MMASPVARGRLEELQVYRLLQCVHEDNKLQIEKLITRGVDNLLNLTEPRQGKGAMHIAAVANNTDMLDFLLSHGASPNVQDKSGKTPVMLAAELGHDGAVALLVKHKANVSLLDKDGKGVLFYCIYPTKRHMRCMHAVLKALSDINNVSLTGQHVLHLACAQADSCLPMCLLLLERGAHPDARDEATGRTALMEAARVGSVELVRSILRGGADPNALDKTNLHAAHFAAEGGFFEVIQVLCAYGADVGAVTKAGETPLHYAARGGHAECCRFLAQRGCNPKLKNEEGLLARQIAKDNGHKAAVKELKKAERLHGKFSRPGVPNPNETWALALYDWSQEHEVTLRKAFDESGDCIKETVSTETFEAVLQDLKAPVEEYQLHKVILAHDRRREGVININDFFKGLKYLQKAVVMASYGPKKKKKGGKGGKKGKKAKFTLPFPICTIPPELIYRRADGGPPTFMVEAYHHHTDPNRFSRDHPPKHPIEDDSAWYVDEPEKIYVNVTYCAKTGDLESLQLAFREGVPVDVKDRFYKTPLMTACAYGNYEVAQFLINLGADVNAKDQFSWTPLHHACHAGQLNITELLVESGSQVDTPALSGATPLMRAIESCRPACVEYLIKAGAKVNAKNKKEQNCLDIAWAYADLRVVDLVKAKMDTLPKPKENKRGKAAKPQPKPRPATTSAKEKLSQVAPSSTSMPPADSSLTQKAAAEKSKDDKETVIMYNTRLNNGTLRPVDISFRPRTVWSNLLTTSDLIQRRERRRERLSHEVDFDDFLMPFSQNLRRKVAQTQEGSA
ncbi:hypothetical protein AALO_G00118430 [Alosa alosa]|uniref:Ankyrin repeat and EF-hand domain-containing protein 1 n=1 Tax=Alosa alosa TaxID=278164 RepID=A0AAV6GQR5_9TELE|nr:ankyrin repeat and EF-hand domain-containing protein 1a [Alosa alosa]KAG5277508.1 hypothetical protein AALO_G00118430 [Alosa alosa]